MNKALIYLLVILGVLILAPLCISIYSRINYNRQIIKNKENTQPDPELESIAPVARIRVLIKSFRP